MRRTGPRAPAPPCRRGERPASRPALRRRDLVADELLPNVDQSLEQLDVLPPQPEQLAAAEARRQRHRRHASCGGVPGLVVGFGGLLQHLVPLHRTASAFVPDHTRAARPCSRSGCQLRSRSRSLSATSSTQRPGERTQSLDTLARAPAWPRASYGSGLERGPRHAAAECGTIRRRIEAMRDDRPRKRGATPTFPGSVVAWQIQILPGPDLDGGPPRAEPPMWSLDTPSRSSET